MHGPNHRYTQSTVALVRDVQPRVPVKPPAPIRYDIFPPKTRVRLQRLKTQELNGEVGQVINYDDTKARYNL